MAPAPRIVVVHSSDELYGADRLLLQVLATLRGAVGAEVEVWLPDDVEHGAHPLCERLAELGFDWQHRGVPVLRRADAGPRGWWRLVRDSVTTWRGLRRRRPDLVHLATSACLVVAPLSRAAGVRRCTLHIQERWTGRSASVLRLLARATTTRIAISQYVADAADLRDPDPRVVLNSVDDAAERLTAAPAGRERELSFVVASRWNRWKGHRTLVEAWDRAGCPGRLAILGGPPRSGIGPDVPKLVSELVRRPETVDIVGEVADAAPHIAVADVVILPSDEPEPFGLVVIEAFSLGRPVIAPRAGGPLEVVHEGRTGWFFRPGDASDLARLLAALTPVDVAEAGRQARHVYETRFQPGRYREQVAAAFVEALAPG